jgi:predicted Zn finger-like uncharacterized protein
MSLATRCPACGTVFRVVQDQLKVSEGWVRCGRCHEVFSALEGLFDLERDLPPEGSTVLAQQPIRVAQEGEGNRADIDEPAAAPEPSRVDRVEAHGPTTHFSEAGSTPATRISARDRLEFPDAQFDPELSLDDAPLPDSAGTAEIPSEPEPEPQAQAEALEFMRHAQRQARWQSPKVRTQMVAAATLLLIALALQGIHHFRDFAAARWPVVRSALAAWCEALSCSIDAPRRIDDVVVESSALTRASVPGAFNLSVALRNRGTVTVALPSVDLSLTDPSGQLVARRVLTPRDFRTPSAAVQPGADLALRLTLAAGGTQFTGYTVEIFYP